MSRDGFAERGALSVAVIVQCRLSSTRLFGKALMDLGGSPILAWTLDAMSMVKAERYFLACDYDSESALRPVAEACRKAKWEVFAGSLEDVLGRFCSLIETRFPECDVVVRATADNPFLFYEAASVSVEEFTKNYFDADYFTITGLPHGSGVEVFKAASILKAREETDLPYDHEHVGPAIYNHGDRFKSVFLPASSLGGGEVGAGGQSSDCEGGEGDFSGFFFPELVTTIDTYADYKRAQKIVQIVSDGKKTEPYTTRQIIEAFKNPLAQKTVLLVPRLRRGNGTGHLRRALWLAREHGLFVHIDREASLEETKPLLDEALAQGLNACQIVDVPIDEMILKKAKWDLVVADLFKSEPNEMEKLLALGAVCSVDDGFGDGGFGDDGFFDGGASGERHNNADYLLDVIPSDLRRRANCENAFLIPLPKNRKGVHGAGVQDSTKKTAIVVIGGEKRDDIALRAALALCENSFYVTLISSASTEELIKNGFDNDALSHCAVLPKIENLREELYKYDVVFSHYGFTAFEAASAGCGVILAATSELHKRLSERYGFVCIEPSEISAESVAGALQSPKVYNKDFLEKAFRERGKGGEASDVVGLPVGFDTTSEWRRVLENLAMAQRFDCPVCKSHSWQGTIAARTRTHTFRRCPDCGMLYLSFSTDSRVVYEKSYFDSEYKEQYGKTYLEDFASIKAQGLRRAKIIKKILSGSTLRNAFDVLDVGCAYGPFLSAAKDEGFSVYGSDISSEAVSYVNTSLGIKAVRASFLDFDAQKEFGVSGFAALTMWYVIEHIQEIGQVLREVNKRLALGGVFAFSTPSASGVSARFSRQKFFEQSPRDHYSIWEIKNTERVLKRFGFKIKKIVSTGIHPERIPLFKKLKIKEGAFLFSLAVLFCRMLKLGDTFEVYCVKVSDSDLN